MIGARCAPRRLTVCQLTHKSRGNGGGLRPRVWLCLRAAAWGQLDPGWNLTIGKAKPVSPCLGAHEAHPKTTLYGVVFQKLNGPLLTSIRGPDHRQIDTPGRHLLPRRCHERKTLSGHGAPAPASCSRRSDPATRPRPARRRSRRRWSPWRDRDRAPAAPARTANRARWSGCRRRRRRWRRTTRGRAKSGRMPTIAVSPTVTMMNVW